MARPTRGGKPQRQPPPPKASRGGKPKRQKGAKKRRPRGGY